MTGDSSVPSIYSSVFGCGLEENQFLFFQVAYLSDSQLVIAGSRDRNIYTWKISEAVPNGTPPPTRDIPYRTVEEPDKTIEGHTLGVTALAVSNGKNTQFTFIFPYCFRFTCCKLRHMFTRALT